VSDQAHDADEGFHEIQLSGKQLVFLFMATTVVSVVIFLCGVLVGRGVKGDTLNAAESTTASATPPAAATPPADAPPTVDPPVGTGERLTYSSRLEGAKPVAENLKAPSEPKPEPPPVVERPQSPPAESAPLPDPKAAAPAQTAKPTPVPAAASGARAGAWAVQVVALSDRGAANAVVQRLSGKGYPAFVLSPQAGAAVQHYKVQVGRFSDRSEAEQVKTRLKREEQFEPIIVR
jgi:DedD protein